MTLNIMKTHQRIKTTSAIMIVLGTLLALYMIYIYFFRIMPTVWGDPAQLTTALGYQGDPFAIPTSTRVIYSTVQGLPLLFGLFTIFSGLFLLIGFMRAQYFFKSTIRWMSWAGLAMIGVGLFSIVARSVSFGLVNQHHPKGSFTIHFLPDTYDLGFLLAGLLLSVTGWVMTIALDIETENRTFV